jgi:hypothetical protein
VALLLTDGTAATSKCISVDRVILAPGNAGDSFNIRAGTLTNFGSSLAVGVSANRYHMPWQHMRLKWTAADTFAVEFSPDGVSWTALGIAAQTYAMTPTHMGVAVSSNGGSNPKIATFEYLRRS